jgi:hypothetical protein
MIKALWLIGRNRHLGEPLERIYDPPEPEQPLAALGVTGPVLLEIDEPLTYQGVEPTLHIRQPAPSRWMRRSE